MPKRWAGTIRLAAVRLSADEGLPAPQIAERLLADHGVAVPASTVGTWIARPRITGDQDADLRSLRGRMIALCEAEIAVLERKRPTDLNRLAKLAALLRSLEVPSQPNPRRSLRDLGQRKPEGLEALLRTELSEAQTAEPSEPLDPELRSASEVLTAADLRSDDRSDRGQTAL